MAEEQQAAAPAGNKKLIIILAAVIFLLVAGGGGAFFMLSGNESAAGEDGAVAAEEKPPESIYIDLKPEFVINFRDSRDRPKFLKAEMSVATTDDDIEEAVTRHMPAIRNNLVLLLSRQIYDDLVPHEGKEELRRLALEEVQAVLTAQIGKPGVEDLYFSNFVMH
jgi:flagellar FliL protein